MANNACYCKRIININSLSNFQKEHDKGLRALSMLKWVAVGEMELHSLVQTNKIERFMPKNSKSNYILTIINLTIALPNMSEKRLTQKEIIKCN